jgi:hypothetical protein
MEVGDSCEKDDRLFMNPLIMTIKNNENLFIIFSLTK